MLDIGWSELLLVAILAIVFVGPKVLPKLLRAVGVYVGKARRMMAEFQQAFDDLARESELDDLRREVSELKRQTQMPLNNILNTIEKAANAPAMKAEAAPVLPSPEEVERLEDQSPAASIPESVTPELVTLKSAPVSAPDGPHDGQGNGKSAPAGAAGTEPRT